MFFLLGFTFVLGFWCCVAWMTSVTYSCGFSYSILIQLIYSYYLVGISSTLNTLVISSSVLLVLRVLSMNWIVCQKFGDAIFLYLLKIYCRSRMGPSHFHIYSHLVFSVVLLLKNHKRVAFSQLSVFIDSIINALMHPFFSIH
jgi:hypothetical protein